MLLHKMGKSLVLGFFDGVHKAHRAVIESALNISDDVTLVTFKNSPAVYFGKKCEYILSRKNSLEKIKTLGVKDIVELEFSKIASIKAEDYLEYLVNTYHPISISTGFNHTFGLEKLGNPELLNKSEKKYGYKYICVPPVIENGEIVSSTLIRKYLKEAEIEKANSLLESNFILEGEVIHGAKIGRTIGFPTANINYPKDTVKIPFGVYKVLVNIEDKHLTPTLSSKESELNPSFKERNCSGFEPLYEVAKNTNSINEQIYIGADYKTDSLSLEERGGVRCSFKPAIMNWGMKPTVNNTVEPVIEVHILNYNGDLYGKNIKIEVLKQIRGEKKFANLDDLKSQINEDIKECLKL